MTTDTPVRVCGADSKSLIEKYDTFLFDCDGVLWLSEDAIGGATEAINHLHASGKKVLFVTNNSSKSRGAYLEKFVALGFGDINIETIWPTCYSAAMLLFHDLNIPVGSKVWVLGDTGIEQELKNQGYIPVGGTSPQLDDAFLPDHPALIVDPEVRAVVVGSTKNLNYLRICLTLQYLMKDLPFIGTNIDRTYPAKDGMVFPAGGSVVENLLFTSNREYISAGKPLARFLDLIVETHELDRSRTLMIGDTIYTDIKFGNDGGIDTLLVLSGGSKVEDMQRSIGTDTAPVYYLDSVADLVPK